MLDSTIVLLSAFIAPVCTLIGGYVLYKKVTNTDKIIDVFEDILADVTENPDLQKRLYLIGGLIGQGARQGIGLQRGRGKMKLEDIVMQLIGGYIQNKVLPQGTPETTPQPNVFQQP